MNVYRKIRRRKDSARPAHRAMTLVEALLASTILAFVAASAAIPFVAVAQQTQAASEYEMAVELAEELMEEVLARPFFAPGETAPSSGPEAGETERKKFNAVDDFNGYTEFRSGSDTKYLFDYKGTNVNETSMKEYWRAATVEYVRLPDQAAADASDSFARIKVTVYRGNRLLYTLVRIKTREY